MGKFKRLLLIVSIFILSLAFLPSKRASANPSLTSYSQLQALGVPQQKLYEHTDGYFYFWQAGTKPTGNNTYYDAIGLEIQAKYKNVVYSGAVGANRYKEVHTYVGNTQYTLYSIAKSDILKALKHRYSADKLLFLVTNSQSYELTINALVVEQVYNGTKHVASGTVHANDGYVVSGKVYTNPAVNYNGLNTTNQLKYTTTVTSFPAWMQNYVSELEKFWDVYLLVTGKPNVSFMSAYTSINKKSSSLTIKAHYDDGVNRWVNAKDPFSISADARITDSLFASYYGSPDNINMTISRFEGTADPANIKASSIINTGKAVADISINNTGNFTLHSAKGSVGGTSPVRSATVNLKANDTSDGSLYLARSRGQLIRNNLTNSGNNYYAMDGTSYQVLRVDSRPPDTPNGANDLTVTTSGNNLTVKAVNLRDITHAHARGENQHYGSGIKGVWANVVNSAGTTKTVSMTRSGATATATYDLTAFGTNPDGTYTVKFYAEDNVGNQSHLGDKIFTLQNNTPKYSTTTSISNYNYRNDTTKVFWYNGNTDVLIDVTSTVENATPNYHALFVKDSSNGTDLFHADMYTSKYQTHTALLGNGGDATRRMTVTGTTTKTAKSTFAFRPNSNVDQKVGVVSGAIYQDANNYGSYYTDGYKVGFDLLAPTYTDLGYAFHSNNNEISVELSNLADKGSGLNTGANKARYRTYPDGMTAPGWTNTAISEGYNIKGMSVTGYTNHANYRLWTFEFEIFDNVGNSTLIKRTGIVRRPVIANKSILTTEHEYTNGTTMVKWVKAGDPFVVTHEGTGRYQAPTGSQVRFSTTNASTDVGWRSTATASGTPWHHDSNFSGITRSKTPTVTISAFDNTGTSTIKSINEFTADSTLHGKIYYVSGMTERSANNVLYAAPSWLFETHRLGIDAKAPIITVQKEYGWTNRDVTIPVKAVDGESGVKNIQIYNSSTKLSEDTSSTMSHTLTNEGIYNLTVKSNDNVGNQSSESVSVKIDKTNPSGVFEPNSKSWTKDNITVSFNPSDELSGVEKWRYAISTNNGSSYGSWTEYIDGDTTSNITLSAQYLNKIKVEVVDIAKNVGTVISGTYQIDKTAPTATSYDVVDRQDDAFTIDIVGVTDGNGSGVKSQTVKVWVDTPSGTITKLYTPVVVNNTTGRVIVNRNDFNGVTKTYYYQLTLEDKVGNSRTYAAKTGTMIQNNLTANRIDIYDPRENRYVSQVISGLQYQAVLEVKNTGERAISKSFDIGLKINGIESKVITETSGIAKDQIKDYKFDFIAGDENLKGLIYEGIADYNNIIYETNENDNNKSSENPYSTPRTDENPPIIPPTPPPGDKFPNPVPIITVKLDLVANYIDIVNLNSETVVTEVITEDTYRFKYRIENNSSLALRYLDILQKTFGSKIYYDGTEIGSTTINDMNKGEVKTFYKEYKVPLLPDDIVEAIKPIRLDVDVNNSIKETDETNNSISKNKKIIGLKVTDYRITNSVNPITTLNYPIYTSEMPLRVKAGYNVTFMVNVLGKPDRVYSKVKDSRGKDYGIVEMTKVRDIDSVRSEWTYTFAPNVDTEDDTMIITEVYATRNSFTYNYNSKENWNGNTLKIGGNAKQDVIIYRRY